MHLVISLKSCKAAYSWVSYEGLYFTVRKCQFSQALPLHTWCFPLKKQMKSFNSISVRTWLCKVFTFSRLAGDVVNIFEETYFLCGLEWGVVDNNVLWCWQQLCKGLYDIISALPEWAELNEFHVITGSVCKQPHVMFETTASISRSFFLFQSLHFILSRTHLCSILMCVRVHACTHTFPFYALFQWEWAWGLMFFY